MTVDKIDIQILKTLIQDARLSSRRISQKTGFCATTVLARMRKMEAQGLIKGYTAVIDHEKLGYELTALIEIEVSKGCLSEMQNEISRMHNVCSVYEVTELSDAFVLAKFKNRAELSAFAKRLLSLPYVERTHPHIVLSTVKEDFRLI